MILRVGGQYNPPDADLIEAISYSSANPYFRSQEFRLALIKYRKDGCTAEHPKKAPTARAIKMASNARINSVKG